MTEFGGHGDGKGGSEGDKKTPQPVKDSGQGSGARHGGKGEEQPQEIGKAN